MYGVRFDVSGSFGGPGEVQSVGRAVYVIGLGLLLESYPGRKGRIFVK